MNPVRDRGSDRSSGQVARSLLAVRRSRAAERANGVFLCLLPFEWLLLVIASQQATGYDPRFWQLAASGAAIAGVALALARWSPAAAWLPYYLALWQVATAIVAVDGGVPRPLTAVILSGALGLGVCYRDWRVPSVAALALLIHFAGRAMILQTGVGVGWLALELGVILLWIHEGRRELREAISEEARRMVELNTDALTGLPNRTFMHSRLSEAVRRGRRLAVMCIDLDRFQWINDTFGEEQGDAILRESGRRLLASVGDRCCAGRDGGDQFLAIIEEERSDAEIEVIAGQILEAFRAPFLAGGRSLRVTVSIGITTMPENGVEASHLAAYAELALNQVKRSGRNGYRFFSSEFGLSELERLGLENDLRIALERDEFELFYQPQFDMDSRLVGMEALVRWRHPDRGLVPPDVFIDLAEETGLIQALGTWVMQSACEQCRKWIDKGYPPIRIAVNVSAAQLVRRGFTQTVSRILEQTGIPPHLLELELTETAVMRHLPESIDELRLLRHLGVGIAIDDFGTGYSSLARLQTLPADCLKIDRCFVQSAATSAVDQALVETIIRLAHHRGLTVIAEGVETEMQRELLVDAGCDRVQGFLQGGPGPPETAEEYLRNLAPQRIGNKETGHHSEGESIVVGIMK